MSRHGTYDLKLGFIPDDDCPQQETSKQTNADRIRSMSDEELAAFLCNISSHNGCSGCIADDFCSVGHTGMLDWLRQECE